MIMKIDLDSHLETSSLASVEQKLSDVAQTVSWRGRWKKSERGMNNWKCQKPRNFLMGSMTVHKAECLMLGAFPRLATGIDQAKEEGERKGSRTCCLSVTKVWRRQQSGCQVELKKKFPMKSIWYGRAARGFNIWVKLLSRNAFGFILSYVKVAVIEAGALIRLGAGRYEFAVRKKIFFWNSNSRSCTTHLRETFPVWWTFCRHQTLREQWNLRVHLQGEINLRKDLPSNFFKA